MTDMTDWGLVIDTDSYAGNFERQLCGFVTGIHDDTHGQEEADAARDELDAETTAWMESNVEFNPDDNGYHRCAELYPTEGWFNHGMGEFFRDGQEEEALADHRKRVAEYQKDHPGALKGAENQPLSKCPAFMSVVIWFDSEPPEGYVEMMKERALRWAKTPGPEWRSEKPTITGFRVVKKTTETTTVEVEG
jgi:hypothetical protein